MTKRSNFVVVATLRVMPCGHCWEKADLLALVCVV